MVGTFRVSKDGRAIFKMKHFDRGLLGWEEEKADMVRLSASVNNGQGVSSVRRAGPSRDAKLCLGNPPCRI
jgi:hypothetical protein